MSKEDWQADSAEVEAIVGGRHANPFALFVLAHLLIVPTANDTQARAAHKLRLWQRACEYKMEEQDHNCLLRLIDWMLLLPTTNCL